MGWGEKGKRDGGGWILQPCLYVVSEYNGGVDAADKGMALHHMIN